MKLLIPAIRQREITGIVKSRLYRKVKKARIVPIAYEPLSPRNTFAGLMLKARNVTKNVRVSRISKNILLCPYWVYSRYAKKRKDGIAIPAASPSIPSVILKEFNMKASGIAKMEANTIESESRKSATNRTRISIGSLYLAFIPQRFIFL